MSQLEFILKTMNTGEQGLYRTADVFDWTHGSIVRNKHNVSRGPAVTTSYLTIDCCVLLHFCQKAALLKIQFNEKNNKLMKNERFLFN